ncbi:MAG: hypothetical protein IPO25_23085 [Saprospiraceae bacterium]|nr:hypothetical protein [Saprospiraceae bacterium]
MPQTIKTKSLRDWSQLLTGDDRYFSGTVSYNLVCNPPVKKSPYYLLDLGEVRGTASILLNDLPVATCLGPEYKAIIPASAFHKSKNKLEITSPVP